MSERDLSSSLCSLLIYSRSSTRLTRDGRIDVSYVRKLNKNPNKMFSPAAATLTFGQKRSCSNVVPRTYQPWHNSQTFFRGMMPYGYQMILLYIEKRKKGKSARVQVELKIIKACSFLSFCKQTWMGLFLQGLQGSPAFVLRLAAFALAISRHLKISSLVWWHTYAFPPCRGWVVGGGGSEVGAEQVATFKHTHATSQHKWGKEWGKCAPTNTKMETNGH